MTGEPVLVDVRDSVAWITINRPQAFNALDLPCARLLAEVANRCGSDPAVRAVVLTGAGEKAFCAGGDVAAFASDPATVDVFLKDITGHLNLAVSRFAAMNAPVIAAVNGIAAGAGLSLVAGCDLAITAETARFTSAYTQIGLSPDGGSTYFLSRLIGPRRAMDLYLNNPLLSAEQALEWGIVNRVVPAADLMAEVETLALRLAAGPTLAYGGVKALLAAATNDTLESQMARESRQISTLSRTQDGLEGVAAFAAKRKPVFSGH
ncbi:MAG: enoyl-CoA hydratase [Rhodospirillaceae bacterium]|nr:enoyl-CoA hydratase [Rhodospirillaceae bacterium]